eukprot:1159433-Pelagomonas_calceolata.AAC.5
MQQHRLEQALHVAVDNTQPTARQGKQPALSHHLTSAVAASNFVRELHTFSSLNSIDMEHARAHTHTHKYTLTQARPNGDLLALSVNSSLYDPYSHKSDVHAEANAVCAAARKGLKLEGWALRILHSMLSAAAGAPVLLLEEAQKIEG